MPKFFGQYLLDKDLLTKDQLLKVVAHQRSRSAKLGDLAIRKSYLTRDEVSKIHREQLRTDMLFGELAVKMKYLTPDQVRELLTMQESSHVFFGEAAVDLGIIAQQQVDEELSRFREEELSESLETVMPENLPNRMLLSTLANVSIKLFQRVADILVKPAHPKSEQYYTLNPYLIALVAISGTHTGKCALKLTKNVASLLAQRFTHNDGLADEELIGDAVGEFLNIICGNVASKLVASGTVFEISTPTILWHTRHDMLKFEQREYALVLPFFTSEGFAEVLFVSRAV